MKQALLACRSKQQAETINVVEGRRVQGQQGSDPCIVYSVTNQQLLSLLATVMPTAIVVADELGCSLGASCTVWLPDV